MFFEGVPTNRWITVALVVGILALIVYGALNRDPVTFVVAGVFVVVVAPMAVFTYLGYRKRRSSNRED